MTLLLIARRTLGAAPTRIAALALALLASSPAVALAASPSPSPSTGTGKSTTAPLNTAPKATYGLGPASATGIDGRPSFKWSASPDGTLKDHVAVVNVGSMPLTLDLYARDAVNQPDGDLGLQTKATKPTDVGAWITMEIPSGASSVTVPARSSVIVPVSLVVPRNASPGDHTGGIIVSLTTQSTSTGKQALTPNLEQRVAVPVALRISGPLQPKLSVQSLSASYGQTLNPVGGGHATVTYKVINTGNVNLGGHEAVSIAGLLGSTVHAKAPDLPVLLPGNSLVESVPVDGVLPEFLMSARVAITPLAASGDVDPGLIASSGSKHFWAVPWLLLGILALLLVAWRQMRRRKHPSTGRHGTRSGGGSRRRRTTPRSTPARKPADVAPGGITVANSVARLIGRYAVALLLGSLGFAIPAATASAASLPYRDTSATGLLGFCDKNGNNVTHGSVYDKPFVWRAIGAAPAPDAVRGSGRNATLYAYQPRKGVDPTQWTGEQLTGTSAYSNPMVPIAQATSRDEALSDYLNDLPPQWGTLIEFRLYYGALNVGTVSTTYPVADIRVSGTTWTLVDGAKVSCDAGSAVSAEAALASSNPAGLEPPQPLSKLAAKAVGAPIPNDVPSGSASSPTSAHPTENEVDASASSGSSHSSHISTVLVILAVLLLLAAGGLYWRARGRSS